VEFPMKFGDHVIVEEEINVIDQLEVQKFLQTWWSDNGVSATNYFKPGELPAIKKWLEENYDDSVKSTSFLKSTGHGFDQAPLEKIDKKTYEKMVAETTPITRIIDTEEREMVDSLECAGGHCPIK